MEILGMCIAHASHLLKKNDRLNIKSSQVIQLLFS